GDTPELQRSFPWRPRFHCGGFGVADRYQESFQRLLETARRKNSRLEILAAQWYGSDVMAVADWGGSLSALSRQHLRGYAQEVRAFLEEWNLQGYVVDFEGTNVVRWYTELLVALASAFRASAGDRRLQLGVSPSTARDLKGTDSLTDYVLVQSYAPKVDLDDYLAIFDPHKVYVGLCPEGCWNGTAEAACGEVLAKGLGGMHVWRLNNGNATRMAE
ncbi:unnamed protein product, partial [Effrenium voratum]